ncbi:hypothetical protein CLS_38560 [[Clostridium] cf. saccharolyticum K10]|nr:hypothetical protein CLS_38560 [[Clostridium] cf. saccharolyticum K10]
MEISLFFYGIHGIIRERLNNRKDG